MAWYVYIAEARTGYFYTGITTNSHLRMIRHNSGRGSQMGRQQEPFELVYTSGPISNKILARQREIQLKGWNRSKKLKLINREWK